MSVKEENQNIKDQRCRGNKLGFLFFQCVIKVLGLTFAYYFLYFVSLYYLIFDRDAVRKSAAYITHRFVDCSTIMQYIHTYRLFISQGKHLIDHYLHKTNPSYFEVDIRGDENQISNFKDSSDGLIILTSHIGNWQLGIKELKHLKNKAVNILIRPEENRAVRESIGMKSLGDINFISTDEYLGGSLEIINALNRGEIVVIMGDRSYGSKTLKVEFLGDNAQFPYSAFVFSLALKCSIVNLSVIKEDKERYSVHLTELSGLRINKSSPRMKKAKVEQLRPAVQEFVAELEGFLKEYPYQCFLFNDIWENE